MEKILTSVFWEDCKAFFAPFERAFFQGEGKFDITKVAFALNNWEVAGVSEAACKNLAFAMLDNNRSEEIFALEDKCLFYGEKGEALKIVLEHRDVLESGQRVSDLWAYLDDGKKAVVSFSYNNGWQVCLICLSKKNLDALHVCDCTNVAVMFRKDISQYLEKARLAGGFCLKEYLPRDIGDLLSKKSSRDKKLSEKKSQRLHDEGDFL